MNEVLKEWMNATLIEEMDEGVLNAPQDLLGMHMYNGMQLFVVRRPGAEAVWITSVKGDKAYEAEELDCELGMKERAGVTSRCMPLEQERVGDTCVCCGKPARHSILWGVAY